MYCYRYRQLTSNNLEVREFSTLRKSTKRRFLLSALEIFHDNCCLLKLRGRWYIDTQALRPGPSRDRVRWSFLLLWVLWLWLTIIKYHEKALILPEFLFMKTVREDEITCLSIPYLWCPLKIVTHARLTQLEHHVRLIVRGYDMFIRRFLRSNDSAVVCIHLLIMSVPFNMWKNELLWFWQNNVKLKKIDVNLVKLVSVCKEQNSSIV